MVMVMDNLCGHTCERVRELAVNAGCELLYLSPYSPDLNSFEETFSKVKSLLRQAERLGTGKHWYRRWVKCSMCSRPKGQTVPLIRFL
jgi:transposase